MPPRLEVRCDGSIGGEKALGMPSGLEPLHPSFPLYRLGVACSCGEYGMRGKSWVREKVPTQIAVRLFAWGGVKAGPTWTINLTMPTYGQIYTPQKITINYDFLDLIPY